MYSGTSKKSLAEKTEFDQKDADWLNSATRWKVLLNFGAYVGIVQRLMQMARRIQQSLDNCRYEMVLRGSKLAEKDEEINQLKDRLNQATSLLARKEDVIARVRELVQ